MPYQNPTPVLFPSATHPPAPAAALPARPGRRACMPQALDPAPAPLQDCRRMAVPVPSAQLLRGMRRIPAIASSAGAVRAGAWRLRPALRLVRQSLARAAARSAAADEGRASARSGSGRRSTPRATRAERAARPGARAAPRARRAGRRPRRRGGRAWSRARAAAGGSRPSRVVNCCGADSDHAGALRLPQNTCSPCRAVRIGALACCRCRLYAGSAPGINVAHGICRRAVWAVCCRECPGARVLTLEVITTKDCTLRRCC